MTADSKPAASVVLPTFNRSEKLRLCLDSLASQAHPLDDFEVVVADDGSTDGSAELLEHLDTPLRLTPLLLGSVGQSAARNAGIEAAQGTICIMLDDDVLASPDLVSEHIKAHRELGAVTGIGALYQPPSEDGDWYSDAYARAWNRHYERLEREPAKWSDCYGGNLSAPREALLAIGGFATDLAISKDFEIGFRLEQHGCKPTYLAAARAVHDDRKPCRRLLSDLEIQAAGYVDLIKLHPEMQANLFNLFMTESQRELALRRLLISLRVPPRAAASLGRIVPTEHRRDLWYEFVRKFAFWFTVRQRVDKREWLRLTGAGAEGA